MTGAGGEGGPLGIFLLILKANKICNLTPPVECYRNSYLNLGGSIGSFCTSTMRITRCFAPELNDVPS